MKYVVALSLAFSAVVCAQAPVVVSLQPAANGTLGPFEPIRVQFAAPIAAATVTPHSFAVFGRWTGAVAGSLTVDPGQTAITFQPWKPLLVGDVVRVALARTITSAQGTPLAGGYHFELVVRTAPGSGVFQLAQQIPFRVANEGQISTYGIHAGDVDRDGTPDITAINEMSHDLRVYKNDGCGSVGPMTLVGDGLNWPSPHESADFNRDGWLDLVTGDYLFGNMSVFFNDGQGNYLPPLGLTGGSYIRSVGAGDLDGDGYPDIVAGNGSSTLVWRNNGSGGFLPPVGYGSLGSAELNVVDANEDGHLDIVMCDLVPGRLWVLIGNGDGTFAANATLTTIGGAPFASAAGDINGDGHVDIVYACRNPDSCRWFFGDGAGGFTAAGSLPAGSWPTSVHLGDLEGDGDLDAVLSHYNAADFRIYSNDGTGNFLPPVILPAISGGSCTTLVDFDRDGDLDIIGADEIVDVGMIYAQTGPVSVGLQQPGCGAALRIDQRGAGDGFAGRPAVPVRVGNSMALSLSGPPGGFGVLCLGFAATGTVSLQWGSMSLDPALPIATLMAFSPPLDAHGELVVPLALPAWVPPGFGLCVQGAVFAPGSEVLSNPVQFVFVP